MTTLSPTEQTPTSQTKATTPTSSKKTVNPISELLMHPHAFRYLILVPTLMLLIIGLVMVASASMLEGIEKWDDPLHFTARQILFLVVGVFFAGVVYLIATKCTEKTVGAWSWVFLLAVFVLEGLTFVPGIGHEMGGNRNWVTIIGDQRIQPAEFAKLALVWWGAAVFATKSKGKESLLNSPMQILTPFFWVGLLFTGLVVVQKDLGTGAVLAVILLLVLWIGGIPVRILSMIMAVMAMAVAYYIFSEPTRVARVLAFLNPGTDLAGANYQHGQAQLAFARGGWFGVGLNASRQKWNGLPEAHTDYILAVTGEELGLICVLLIIGLFFILGYAGFKVALLSDIPFYKYAAAGVTAWILVAAIGNIAVAFGLFPVFGVPLPFLSSGGSSLVAVLGGTGLLLACSSKLPAARNAPVRQDNPMKVTVVQA